MGCSPSSSSSKITPVSPTEVPRDFHDQYLLGIKLGRGAFAQVRIATEVFAAPISTQTHEVAVKILDLRDPAKPEASSSVSDKSARNEQGCWEIAGNHPNCIRLFEVSFSNNLCYFVMEKCSSGLLQALESMPELTERGLGNVFAQMLLGISHCHSVSIVHRDIKPDNFLVGGQGSQTIKLGDFGLSTMLRKQGKLHGLFGTAPFMSPEMLAGPFYDEKADVWSYAVVVYALLFGSFPYLPKKPNSKAMKEAIMTGIPSLLPSFESPRKLKEVFQGERMHSKVAISFVQALLHRDPAQRPSAEEALAMPWMSAAMQGSHCQGEELPSLRATLLFAKKVGAFEVRDTSTEEAIDPVLSSLQMKHHGVPLPVTPKVARPVEKPAQREKRTSEISDTSSESFSDFSGWSKGTEGAFNMQARNVVSPDTT